VDLSSRAFWPFSSADAAYIWSKTTIRRAKKAKKAKEALSCGLGL
jgi:hypothetical protein